MKKLILLVTFLLISSRSEAQAASVIFDYPIGAWTAIQVQAYTATLFVNGTRFILTDSCVLVTTVTPNVIRCTATLPNISTALTPSGNQNFQVALYDTLPELESPLSTPPLVLQRPSAPQTLRIQ